MKPTYDFQQKLNQSKESETRLVEWLCKQDEIDDVIKCTLEEDRDLGIDFWLKIKDKPDLCPVQLKVDYNTYQTGNITFEMISQAYIDKESVIGWGWKLNHSKLIFFLVVDPTGDRLYCMSSQKYVSWVMKNIEQLKTKRVQNTKWLTIIVLVPLEKLKSVAKEYILD